jgi:ribosomal protein S18 acetylase RimI-like enzyme
MALSTWWRGDPLPRLQPVTGYWVAAASDSGEIQVIDGLTREEGARRMAAGHRLYVGYLGAAAVTYGWVATQSANIGELRARFAITDSDRYLWDFATHPTFRGRGLYPRLLQAIIEAEAAQRFWIINAPENLPSASGLRKAGFTSVGHLSFLADGTPALVSHGREERSQAGAALLGVPLVSQPLSPCWRCGRDSGGCPTCRSGDEHHCDCAVVPHAAST